MNDPQRQLMRAFLLIWSAVWFLVWLALLGRVLRPHGPEPPMMFWWRTGALLAGWAGAFAWKGLERPK